MKKDLKNPRNLRTIASLSQTHLLSSPWSLTMRAEAARQFASWSGYTVHDGARLRPSDTVWKSLTGKSLSTGDGLSPPPTNDPWWWEKLPGPSL